MTLPGGVSRVDGERDAGKRTWFWVAGLVVTLLLAAGVSQLASSEPDGLERVAEDEGFSDAAEEHDLAGSPLADYGVEGVDRSEEHTSELQSLMRISSAVLC